MVLETILAVLAIPGSSPGTGAPRAEPTEAEVAFLDGLTGVVWEAAGDDFSTSIEYRWTVPGRVLEGGNVIRDADGVPIMRYSGLYAWDGAAGSWYLWNASDAGEVQEGPVVIDGNGLWHRIDVRGGGTNAYTSVMSVVDGGLEFQIVYGDREASRASVEAREPLRYRPAGVVRGPLPDEVVRAVEAHRADQPTAEKEARIARLDEVAARTGDWRVAFWAGHLTRFSPSNPSEVPLWAGRAVERAEALRADADDLTDDEMAYVDVLAFLAYDFATFGARLRGDTATAQYRAWSDARGKAVSSALRRAPGNPWAAIVTGTLMINEGGRADDPARVLAGCALQTRGLEALPAAALGLDADWPITWSAAGLSEVRERYGDAAATACRPPPSGVR